MTVLVEQQQPENKKSRFSFKAPKFGGKNKEEGDASSDASSIKKNESKEEKLARKQAKKEQKQKEKEQKKREAKENKPVDVDESDSTSNASAGTSSLKNLFGFESKRPRAEYQAEIDNLKYELEMATSNLRQVTAELQQTQGKLNRFQSWARSAPFN